MIDSTIQSDLSIEQLVKPVSTQLTHEQFSHRRVQNLGYVGVAARQSNPSMKHGPVARQAK